MYIKVLGKQHIQYVAFHIWAIRSRDLIAPCDVSSPEQHLQGSHSLMFRVMGKGNGRLMQSLSVLCWRPTSFRLYSVGRKFGLGPAPRVIDSNSCWQECEVSVQTALLQFFEARHMQDMHTARNAGMTPACTALHCAYIQSPMPYQRNTRHE